MNTTESMGQIADRIGNGELTIEQAAELTGWPVIQDCLVPEPKEWHANDGNAEVVFECETGKEAAREYCSEGYPAEAETYWVNVSVWRVGIDSDGDEVMVDRDRHKIAIEPNEPECTESEHDWQSPHDIVGGIAENPGVYGNGGGVTMQEVCIHCGCGKLTDTWAQDPNDGRQGLKSVTYEPGKYTSALEEIKKSEVREFLATYNDDDDIPQDELERIFRLAYDREPDDDDREAGLWSLICASVEG